MKYYATYFNDNEDSPGILRPLNFCERKFYRTDRKSFPEELTLVLISKYTLISKSLIHK